MPDASTLICLLHCRLLLNVVVSTMDRQFCLPADEKPVFKAQAEPGHLECGDKSWVWSCAPVESRSKTPGVESGAKLS